MYDEEKELYKTLDELGYVFSVETGGWYPKDHNPNSVHMNTPVVFIRDTKGLL